MLFLSVQTADNKIKDPYHLRDLKTFVTDIFRKPPVLFPLVAVFHLVWLTMSVMNLVQVTAPATIIAALCMVGYTVFWVATADLRKWGAIGYILMTTANIVAWYMDYSHAVRHPYESPLFIIDLLFCFFIMFYFKRFR